MILQGINNYQMYSHFSLQVSVMLIYLYLSAEVRGGVCTTMVSSNARNDTECLFCHNLATIRCIQCGPYCMCLQCCFLHPTNCTLLKQGCSMTPFYGCLQTPLVKGCIGTPLGVWLHLIRFLKPKNAIFSCYNVTKSV